MLAKNCLFSLAILGLFSNLILSESYDRKIFYGVAKKSSGGQIIIEENPSQTHPKDNYVIIRVKNIQSRDPKKEIGRVRIAVWDSPKFYAKEGEKPFKASSYSAKATKNNEMLFKIGGLTPGKSYSFFAHFDRQDLGKVARFLGIPKDPYVFSNGLKRKGFGPPEFEKTLIKYEKPGQEIVLNF